MGEHFHDTPDDAHHERKVRVSVWGERLMSLVDRSSFADRKERRLSRKKKADQAFRERVAHKYADEGESGFVVAPSPVVSGHVFVEESRKYVERQGRKSS